MGAASDTVAKRTENMVAADTSKNHDVVSVVLT
jgi:hypothetical protein